MKRCMNCMSEYNEQNSRCPRCGFSEEEMNGAQKLPSSEEMADFLLKILEEGGYGTLVLDIGNYGRQVLPLLEICQAVYMPIREDAVSRAKLQEFEQYVEKSGKKTVAGKFHKIHVPMVTGMKRMEHFPQELLWGDLGDFVRGMLKGQRGIWES